VLYGDNAVGGVVNIITKTGAGLAKPVTIRGEAGVGSFNQRMGNVSVGVNAGPWSSVAFGNVVTSDGYRVNNALNQVNGVGEIRYATPDLTAFLNLSGDDQHLGFPGGRIVDPSIGVNELATDRRGAATPRDYGDKQGANATAGVTKSLGNGVDLIIDGGVRNKKQQAGFFTTFAESYVDSTLQTWSITPRLSIKNVLFGLPSQILTGVDYYYATYDSDRSLFKETAPIHVYNLKQQTLAGYWQQTLAVLPSTDFSYGGRLQQTNLEARDRFDPTAPGAFDAQHTPLNSDETQYALHIGVEHRVNDAFALFGRAARAFRTPNVDERLVTGPAFGGPPFFLPIPQNFELRTQTSFDFEGGIRLHGNQFDIQSSIYDMHLRNEIHFDPVNFLNYNLDPTHRYGSETSAVIRINDTLRLKGSFAYTRAVFSEGTFTGMDVPLVSRLSGSAGISWNAWQKYLVLDATLRAWSSRRMDNDQANTQPLIPANATLDLKLSGEIDRFFWSAAVLNVFNALYYDYAVASAFTSGRFNAYPLPGRLYMLKAGVTF